MSFLGWPAAAIALLPAPFGRKPASTAATSAVHPDVPPSLGSATATSGRDREGSAYAFDADSQELAECESIFSEDSRRERGWHIVRPEGHRIYYELHGHGPKHVVFLMGLSNTSFSWTHQVAHFAGSSEQRSTHSVLVLDNRGSGLSGYPSGSWAYSTSAMAADVTSLLTHLGWLDEKSVDVVGLSMGGMIALELARTLPAWLRSLTLAVTSSGHGVWRNLPPSKGFEAMRRLTMTTAPKDRMAIAVELLFPPDWLDQRDPNDGQGRTNRETRLEEYAKRYAITRPQLLAGNIGQSLACLTHHVPPSALASIGRSTAKVCVLVGDDDAMVDVTNSEFLFEHLHGSSKETRNEPDEGAPEQVEIVRWEGTGHAIHLQWPQRFNALLERVWREADERLADGGAGPGDEI